MKELNSWFKICAVVLFAMVFVFGCKKTDVTNSNTAETETTQMKDWLDANVKNNKNIDTTSTGLFYIVDKVGSGPIVLTGDSLTVKYTGMFMDGTVFDFSKSYSYVHKAIGQRMIQGWEEGIEVLSKGGSAVFLIPSAKAYGDYGYAIIPPFSPLLFTIEVIDIK
jgi:FKBP-type peptidyl-prolyl cis-trans isomerase